MSKIELLNKKIFENLKQVAPPSGGLDHYVNGGAHAPRTYDFKVMQEMKEEQNKDRNTDKNDV